MHRMARRTTALGVALAAVGMIGCQSAGLRFLSLIGFQKDPLIVALVAEPQPAGTDKPFQALNPFAPYDAWRQDLSAALERPVGLDLCFPVQLEPCLSAGMYHAAILSAGQYARLAEPGRYPVLAVPTDSEGRVARPALLVVAADGPIRSVEELRGKTIAFGPAGDARTHYAALRLLAEHGLQKTDLSLQALPVLGSLKHLPDMRSVAQTVINASSDAGFIDEAAFAAFPEHDARPGEPARDRLRVLARTVAVPDRLILASPKLDAATQARVRAFLLAAGREHPDALRPLRVARYAAPTEDLLAACAALAHSEEPDREQAAASPP